MISNVSFKGLPIGTRYISPKMIVGKRQSLFGLRKLQHEEGVDFVIDLSNKKNFPFTLIEKYLCKLLKLKRFAIPINLVDKKFPLKETFSQINNILKENESKKVFIHCRSGKHRSVLIAAAKEIMAKRINNTKELDEFLRKNDYYTIKHTRKLLIPFKPTAEEIKIKTDRLNLQRKRFIDILFSK